MSDTLEKPKAPVSKMPTHRCKDFDEDCDGLDHLNCWLYDMTTGYCPYLRAPKDIP